MLGGSWRGVKVERGLWSESLQDDEITSARQRVQQPSPTRVHVHAHALPHSLHFCISAHGRFMIPVSWSEHT